MRILVAGAGVFGVTAALELRRRGHEARLIDPGPVPHPLAASTDISKVVRLEYGDDEEYTALAEESIEGWRRWNHDFGVELFHETGVVFLRRTPPSPGTLEQDSYELVKRRGHRPEMTDARRWPQFTGFSHALFDPEGGFVESGRAVAQLAGLAAVEQGAFTLDAQGYDQIVCALGAWTPHALPWLAGEFRSTGHPVFHLKPPDEALAAA